MDRCCDFLDAWLNRGGNASAAQELILAIASVVDALGVRERDVRRGV
jgi:hypothetical protein